MVLQRTFRDPLWRCSLDEHASAVAQRLIIVLQRSVLRCSPKHHAGVGVLQPFMVH